MKKIRILSAVLAILLAFSAISLPVFATDITSAEIAKQVETIMTEPITITSTEITDYTYSGVAADKWTSQRLKVQSMRLSMQGTEYDVDGQGAVYKDDNWAMYMDKVSGEFALLNRKTAELTFSNPYDITINPEFASSLNTSDKEKNDPIRQALLSQIILSYEDVATATTYTMKSFTDAVLAGDQISFQQIDGGMRVEYAIGTVETKRLFPQWITKERFESQILNIFKENSRRFTESENQVYQQILTSVSYRLVGPAPEGSVYDPQSIPSPEKPETYQYLVDHPGEQMYVLQGVGERAKKNLEAMIRKYCPEYTFDKLEEDHEITGYEGNEKEPPLFRMAVEYTLDKSGLKATIPAKSVRFNETNYRLNTIALLPYFGCTTIGKTTGSAGDADGAYTRDGGYVFIPDGSGTLLSYYNDDGTLKSGIQGGSMYGQDFAIESLPATEANAETYRVPVFGLVEEYYITKSQVGTDRVANNNTGVVLSNVTNFREGKRGFFAIIEEGEAFASVRANLRQTGWAGASGSTEYSTVFALFTVKQNDSVNVGSSIGGSSSSMTATNDTKYIGNYTIRYTMLSDPETADAADYSSFEPSYIGMAQAYRQYLIGKGAIDKLVAENTKDTLPLYIHSFGSLNAQDTFLSIPITVEKPLTTFSDVMTMHKELKDKGITNLNFILEGFANGNMSKPYYPTYVKWGKKVGGEKGLVQLREYAINEGFNIYPEFDFSTAYFVKTFSGFSYRKHAARAMSGRYTTKRDYDYVFQVIRKFGMGNVVSSGAYLDLFKKFAKDYDQYTIGGIAALSLGTDLSSDFNEDYSITREDSKLNTMDILGEMQRKYGKVVLEGGNAYTWAYATDILDLPLDNSRYQISSASIPFIGMVLHGYMNYTGGVINTSGDIQYDVLKSLENGAALYFLLSYQNSSEFKNAYQMGLNENYSVNYQTWRDDVVKYYNQLNGAIGSLQLANITDHGFVKAYRMDATAAKFMFAQSDITQKAYTDALTAYENAVAHTNSIVPDGLAAPVRDSLAIENSCLITLNKNRALAELETAFSDKDKISNVVYVTYTEENGNKTTFYINYNSFDVVIETEKGIATLAAESFINENDITSQTAEEFEYALVEALMPTAGQLKKYQAAKENFDKLNAEGSGATASQLAKARGSLLKAISEIGRTTTNVVELTAQDGSVGYFNYETSSILVKISETEYKLVAAQSYVID